MTPTTMTPDQLDEHAVEIEPHYPNVAAVYRQAATQARVIAELDNWAGWSRSGDAAKCNCGMCVARRVVDRKLSETLKAHGLAEPTP